MKIRIKIIEKEIKIILFNGNKILDSYVMEDKRDLGERLIPAVDQLLKRNRIRKESISNVSVASDQSDSFTTTRIAKTFAKIWNMKI